jgi:hypothetical protein
MSAQDPDRESEGPRPTRSTVGKRAIERGGASRFADVAKLAQLTPSAAASAAVPKERDENSGVINLAALSATEPQASAPAPPVATPARLRDASPTAQTNLAAAAPLVPALSSAEPPQARNSRGSKRFAGIGLGVVIGLASAAAVAAAVFVLVRRAEPPSPVAAQIVPPVAPAETSARGSTAVAPVASGSDDKTLALSDLPRVPASASAGEGEHAAPPASAAAASASPPAIAAGGVGSPRSQGGAEAAGNHRDLQAMMQQAVGVSGTSMAPQPAKAQGDSTESLNGGVPLRPSLGAVNGALGTAMPGARACIDSDSPVSHATITFQSDGSVANVAIADWAAGKPVEACIRAALMKARVPPFALPTYTVPATIRSN